MATETPVTPVDTTPLTLTETPDVSKDLTKTLTTTTATAVIVLAGFYVHSKLMPKIKAKIAEHRDAEIVEDVVEPAKVKPSRSA